MRARNATLALMLSAFAAEASAQPQSFHDCIRTLRATQAIEADADGLAMRLRPDAARYYPGRAQRMDKSARISLQCQAVTERPIRCAVTHESLPDFGFGPAAVRIAESGRLTAPAGIWPFDVVVAFRTTPLAHPIFLGYC